MDTPRRATCGLHTGRRASGLHTVCVPLALIACLTSAVFTQSPSPSAPLTAGAPDPDTTPQRIAFNLALTLKMLGDEQFLAGDLTAASETYARAATRFERIPVTPGVNRAWVDLLGVDIAYRRALLAQGLDFWGGDTSGTAASPVAHLKRLENFSEKLSNAINEIAESVSHINDANQAVANLSALIAEVDTRTNISEIEIQKQDSIRTYQLERVRTIEGRLGQLAATRARVAAEAETAAHELRRLNDANSSLLVSTVSNAVGLPVDLSQLTSGGSLRDKLVNIGLGLVNDQGSAIRDHLKGLSTEAASVIELFDRAQAIQQQVESGIQDVKSIAGTFRGPIFENLLRVGSLSWPNLAANERQQLVSAVTSQKPLVALVELARQPGEIRTALTRVIVEQQGFATRWPTAIDAAVSIRQKDVAVWYADTVKALWASGTPRGETLDLVQLVITGWPEPFFAAIPPQMASALLNATQQTSRDAFVTWCGQNALRTIGQISITANKLAIGSSEVDLSSLFAIPDPAIWAVPAADAASAARQALQQFGANTLLRDRVLAHLPLAAIETEIAQLVPAANAGSVAQRAAVFDAIMAKMSGDDVRQRARETLAQIQAGSVIAPDLLQRGLGISPLDAITKQGERITAMSPPSGSAASSPPAPAGTEAGTAILTTALTGALTAAFPPAAIGAAVVKFVSNLFGMSAQIEKIRRAREELRQVVVEELQLYDTLSESRGASALAEYDARISAATAKGAAAQRSIYRSSIKSRIGTVKEHEAKAILISEYVFYLAELMRREYDALEGSLARWLGFDDSPRGIITTLVRNDPQNVRLALDPQIHLFEWLKPGAIAQREDLVVMREQWRRLVTLATEVCRQYGFTEDQLPVSELQASDVLSIKALVSADTWEAFRAWQTARRPEGFQLWFTLNPKTHVQSPLHRYPRIADLRLGGRRQTAVTSLTNFTLWHSGVSHLPGHHGIVRDVLPPKSATSLEPPGTFNLTALRRRWFEPGGAVSVFEGYGPFTTWQLTLLPNEQNYSLDDIQLSFAYQYVTGPPLLPSITRTTIEITDLPIPVEVNADDLASVGDASTIRQKLDGWRTTGAAGTDVPALPYRITAREVRR